LSYTDNKDGTFTDNNTLLMWEEKTGTVGTANPSDVHDVNNTYTWSLDLFFGNPNGSVFTDFLKTLNTSPCFANHCDWRLPNIKELVSLVDYGRRDPAIDPSVPGANQGSAFYWSFTTFAGPSGGALNEWGVEFSRGGLTIEFKPNFNYVRAVRGGS
jgi:hypothetical protein